MTTENMDHSTLISQFVTFTGTDEDRAKSLLEACDWNLDLAVNMHVDMDDGRSNRASTSTPREPDTERPPIRPFRDQIVQGPLGYVPNDSSQQTGAGLQTSTSNTRRYNTRTGASSDSFDAFRDFKAETEWQEAALADGDACSRGAKTLHELFRPPLDLMYRGSFTSARENGQSKNKWLLVNIQNSKEFACQILNRDVWSNATVKDIVRESFIFWQANHDSFDGARYVQFYKVTSYPHLSILDPRTGEQMRSWPTNVDHSSLCDSVIEFLTENPTPENRSVKPPDDGEMQQSEDKKKNQEVIVEDDDDETDEDEVQEIEDYKKYLGTDEEKMSDLVVRFPDGSRKAFKFPSDSLMKALFSLLSSEGYDMKKYNYVTNFPRRLLHELPPTDTLSDAKLMKENIIVERKMD